MAIIDKTVKGKKKVLKNDKKKHQKQRNIVEKALDLEKKSCRPWLARNRRER